MDFSPFVICAPGVRPPKPRGMDAPEGLGDRMRTAAFAEFQAVAAFRWAAERFRDAPPALREAWSAQVGEEARHFGMIRRRMEELGFGLADRPVSTALWDSLQECLTAEEFCIRIASAAPAPLAVYDVGDDDLALSRSIRAEIEKAYGNEFTRYLQSLKKIRRDAMMMIHNKRERTSFLKCIASEEMVHKVRSKGFKEMRRTAEYLLKKAVGS